jgi:hypothetical protein
MSFLLSILLSICSCTFDFSCEYNSANGSSSISVNWRKGRRVNWRYFFTTKPRSVHKWGLCFLYKCRTLFKLHSGLSYYSKLKLITQKTIFILLHQLESVSRSCNFNWHVTRKVNWIRILVSIWNIAVGRMLSCIQFRIVIWIDIGKLNRN